MLQNWIQGHQDLIMWVQEHPYIFIWLTLGAIGYLLQFTTHIELWRWHRNYMKFSQKRKMESRFAQYLNAFLYGFFHESLCVSGKRFRKESFEFLLLPLFLTVSGAISFLTAIDAFKSNISQARDIKNTIANEKPSCCYSCEPYKFPFNV